MTTTERQRPEDRLRYGGPDEILATADRLGAEFAGRAEVHDREGSYSGENIDALWAAGLGNLNVPADLGGVGADLTTTAKVVEAIAKGDPSTALIYVMHLAHLGMMTRPDSAWPDELRQKVIADSLAGPALMNALRVEPELGTPARGGVPATIAVRDQDSQGRPVWRISGRKIYSTGSQGLKWMVVWAATAADDPDGLRIGSFLVPGDSEGVEIIETWDHLGMRASASHDVVFHDVVVPIDHAIELNPPGRADPKRPGPTWPSGVGPRYFCSASTPG